MRDDGLLSTSACELVEGLQVSAAGVGRKEECGSMVHVLRVSPITRQGCAFIFLDRPVKVNHHHPIVTQGGGQGRVDAQ